MNSLTDKQREELKAVEHHLYTATVGNYVRTVTHTEAVLMNRIHIELGLGKQNLTCGKCVLTLCKNLGSLYFNK